MLIRNHNSFIKTKVFCFIKLWQEKGWEEAKNTFLRKNISNRKWLDWRLKFRNFRSLCKCIKCWRLFVKTFRLNKIANRKNIKSCQFDRFVGKMHLETHRGDWSNLIFSQLPVNQVVNQLVNCKVSLTVMGRSTTRNRSYLQISNHDTIGPGFESPSFRCF